MLLRSAFTSTFTQSLSFTRITRTSSLAKAFSSPVSKVFMSSTAYTETWLAGPPSGSTKFYTRTYRPTSSPKAVIVFVHGFAEHIGRYEHFHPRFPEHGIAVFTYDQRGYGKTGQDPNRSPGSAYGNTTWKEQMVDLAWALEHAKKEFSGTPVFLMGHSMVSAALLDRTSPIVRIGVLGRWGSPRFRNSRRQISLFRHNFLFDWGDCHQPTNTASKTCLETIEGRRWPG